MQVSLKDVSFWSTPPCTSILSLPINLATCPSLGAGKSPLGSSLCHFCQRRSNLQRSLKLFEPPLPPNIISASPTYLILIFLDYMDCSMRVSGTGCISFNLVPLKQHLGILTPNQIPCACSELQLAFEKRLQVAALLLRSQTSEDIHFILHKAGCVAVALLGSLNQRLRLSCCCGSRVAIERRCKPTKSEVNA